MDVALILFVLPQTRHVDGPSVERNGGCDPRSNLHSGAYETSTLTLHFTKSQSMCTKTGFPLRSLLGLGTNRVYSRAELDFSGCIIATSIPRFGF